MKTGATAVSTARHILNQWVCRSLMTQGCCQDIWSSWLKNPRQCVDVTWLSNTHFLEYFSSREVTFSFKHYLIFVFFHPYMVKWSNFIQSDFLFERVAQAPTMSSLEFQGFILLHWSLVSGETTETMEWPCFSEALFPTFMEVEDKI